MKVTDIKTVILKWELTGEGYELFPTEGERLAFLVGRPDGDKKGCVITDEIHLSTKNTTFILDIKIQSIITFTKDKSLTAMDIYSIYEQVRPKWRNEISEYGVKEGYVNPKIEIGISTTPFYQVEDSIQKAISQSLRGNN